MGQRVPAGFLTAQFLQKLKIYEAFVVFLEEREGVNTGLIHLQFLQKLRCQKTCWDQTRLSSLVNKQVAFVVKCSLATKRLPWEGSRRDTRVELAREYCLDLDDPPHDRRQHMFLLHLKLHEPVESRSLLADFETEKKPLVVRSFDRQNKPSMECVD